MVRTPLRLSTPFGCSPLMEFPASSDTFPCAEGERRRLPTRLIFPLKEVASTVPGWSVKSVENGSMLVSASRSHGLFAAAESVVSRSLFSYQSRKMGSAVTPPSAADSRSVTSPPSELTVTRLSAE